MLSNPWWNNIYQTYQDTFTIHKIDYISGRLTEQKKYIQIHNIHGSQDGSMGAHCSYLVDYYLIKILEKLKALYEFRIPYWRCWEFVGKTF